MRRTADSLLILADAPTRAAGQERPHRGRRPAGGDRGCAGLPARARRRRPAARGSATPRPADVVHLLTELVDNALSYSSADDHRLARLHDRRPTASPSRSRTPGLGIPDGRARGINETLRSGGDVTPDTARRMGLFVVSRLAQRHGISVCRCGATRRTARRPRCSCRTPSSRDAPARSPAAPAARPVVVPDVDDSARTPTPPRRRGHRSPRHRSRIEARINGALGLPRREPGTSFPQPGAPAPLTPPAPAQAAAPAAAAAPAPAPATAAPAPATKPDSAPESAPAALAPAPSPAPAAAPARSPPRRRLSWPPASRLSPSSRSRTCTPR